VSKRIQAYVNFNHFVGECQACKRDGQDTVMVSVGGIPLGPSDAIMVLCDDCYSTLCYAVADGHVVVDEYGRKHAKAIIEVDA